MDKSLQTLTGALDYSRDLHSKNMNTFNGAKEQYYGYVEYGVNTVKSMLDPTPYVEWASSTVKTYADPDKIVDTGVEYAGKVAAFGPGEPASCIFCPFTYCVLPRCTVWVRACATFIATHACIATMHLYKSKLQLLKGAVMIPSLAARLTRIISDYSQRIFCQLHRQQQCKDIQLWQGKLCLTSFGR